MQNQEAVAFFPVSSQAHLMGVDGGITCVEPNASLCERGFVFLILDKTYSIGKLSFLFLVQQNGNMMMQFKTMLF